MTGRKNLLKDFVSINGGFVSFAGNPKGGKIEGRETVSDDKLELERVNFVSQLCFNLLSMSQVYDKKLSVLFNDTECLFLKPGVKVPEEYV
jgi:hypothetical protein